MRCAWPGYYHSLGLTRIQFDSSPHHSLTLPSSLIRDSATVTIRPEDGTTAIEVESSATLAWILGVASKQLRLLHGRVGDTTTLVNSLSPQMSELVYDAIASWCDIVWHFWLIRNELRKLFELKFEFFSFNTFDVSQIFWQRVVQPRPNYSYCIHLKGSCSVSVCWILNNALRSMSWMFSGFIVCPIVPSIFGTICCVIFQTYVII